MTHDEMRAIRRDIINSFMRDWLASHYDKFSLDSIKEYVRYYETLIYGYELKAYK